MVMLFVFCLSFICLSSRALRFFFFCCYADHRDLHLLTHSFPTRRSSDLDILRKSFGLILLGAALFFSQSLVPSPWILPLWLAFALALLGWCVIEFRRTHQIATRIAISLVGGVVAVAAVLGA